MAKSAAILASCVTVIGLLVGGVLAFRDQSGGVCTPSAVAGGQAAIGGSFSLVNQYGDRVTEKDVIKDLSLIERYQNHPRVYHD